MKYLFATRLRLNASLIPVQMIVPWSTASSPHGENFSAQGCNLNLTII